MSKIYFVDEGDEVGGEAEPSPVGDLAALLELLSNIESRFRPHKSHGLITAAELQRLRDAILKHLAQ